MGTVQSTDSLWCPIALVAAGIAQGGCVLDFEQIEAMVGVLRDAPRLTELEVRSGDAVLRLRRPPPRHKKADKPLREKTPVGGGSPATFSSSLVSSSAAAHSAQAIVTAQLVGVFRADRKALVAAGDSVAEEQVMGHIEAMRLMNDCTAPVAGRIQAVFVQEGQPVEYGQPLFEIVPEGVS